MKSLILRSVARCSTPIVSYMHLSRKGGIMAKLYVTYGNGYAQRNCYSIVEGETELDCYRQIDEICGRHYAFSYRPDDFEDREGKPGQVARWGLIEIPLQPQ